MKKEKNAVRYLIGIGYQLVSEIMCLIMCSMLLALMDVSVIFKIAVGICTIFITLGLFFNWTFYRAKKDRDAFKYHGTALDSSMPYKMAVFAPMLSYIMLLGLYLMKAGVLGDYFNYYLLFNIWMSPFVDIFTSSRVIADISWAGIAGITCLVLLQPAAIITTYIATLKDIDVYKIIFLKKDK